MTFQRNLFWKNLDLVYRSGIAHQFARYALSLKYELLPEDVIHQAKCCLLDALGCAIGAYEAPGRPIVEDFVKDISGREEATVIGSGLRTTALNATLVNSFLVRYLDCNDVGGGGHNSDSIPAILAVSEREKANGRNFITSLVISYELGARFSDCRSNSTNFEIKGWTGDLRGGLTMPPALGRLMGLTEEQIANAIGVCASQSHPLGILDTHREENTMSKNLRFGFVAHDSIRACMLAKRGFTGPLRIVEGENGINEVIIQGGMDFDCLTDFSGWRILDTRFKTLCANLSTQGHTLATMSIVKDHDLKPEDISSVRLRVGLRESQHTTALCKKYPRNAETADHSAFYANAIAIKERHFGPEAFQEEKYTDPVVLDLIEKITVEYDPDIPEPGLMGISEITTRDGRKFKREMLPPDFGDTRLTDSDLEDKFRSMAEKYVSEKNINEIFNTVWNLERFDDLSALMRLIVF